MPECLYCGKRITSSATPEEKASLWHQKCIHDFFGLDQLPALCLDSKTVEDLAHRTVAQGLTVPGVQKKLSLHLSREDYPRLTLVDYPAGYILKPQSPDFKHLPEFEAAAMEMAKACRIDTVPFSLIQMEDSLAYITRRIDRTENGKLAMEDFCQLSHRLTRDKYRGSYESIGKLISEYSSRPGLDTAAFYSLLVFSFLIGNSDLHLKNVSLIETEPGSRDFVLSQIYDILPVNVVLPADKEEMALTLNGKKKNLRRKDFLKLADSTGLTSAQAENLLDRMLKNEKKILAVLRRAHLTAQEKERWKDLIVSRIHHLKKPQKV